MPMRGWQVSGDPLKLVQSARFCLHSTGLELFVWGMDPLARSWASGLAWGHGNGCGYAEDHGEVAAINRGLGGVEWLKV